MPSSWYGRAVFIVTEICDASDAGQSSRAAPPRLARPPATTTLSTLPGVLSDKAARPILGASEPGIIIATEIVHTWNDTATPSRHPSSTCPSALTTPAIHAKLHLTASTARLAPDVDPGIVIAAEIVHTWNDTTTPRSRPTPPCPPAPTTPTPPATPRRTANNARLVPGTNEASIPIATEIGDPWNDPSRGAASAGTPVRPRRTSRRRISRPLRAAPIFAITRGANRSAHRHARLLPTGRPQFNTADLTRRASPPRGNARHDVWVPRAAEIRTSLTFRGRLLLRRARNRPQPRRGGSFSRTHASCQTAIHVNDNCDMTLWIPHDTADIHPTRAAQKPRAGTLPPQHLVCSVRLINAHPRSSRLQPCLNQRKVHSLHSVSARSGPGIISALQLEEALRLRARASAATSSHTQLQALVPPRPQAIPRINDAESPRRDAASKAPTPRPGAARRPGSTGSHARSPVAGHSAERGEDTGHAQRGTTDALPRPLRRPPSSITRALVRALPALLIAPPIPMPGENLRTHTRRPPHFRAQSPRKPQ